MKAKMSRKKAHAISFILFLVGIGAMILIQDWWPSIALVVGLPIAVRQYLLGRVFDTVVSLFVFIGIFITVQFDIRWQLLLPILFTVGGIYIFFREFFGGTSVTEADDEEDLNHEIEEDQHKKDKDEDKKD